MTTDPAAPVGLDRDLAAENSQLRAVLKDVRHENFASMEREIAALLDLVSQQQGVIEAASVFGNTVRYSLDGEWTYQRELELWQPVRDALESVRSLLPREPKNG